MTQHLDLTGAPRIGLGEAKRRYDDGSAVFVDVRKAEEYERSHIPGALSIPLWELLKRTEDLPRDRLIIFY